MNGLVNPHGKGSLRPLFVGDEAARDLSRASKLRKIPISSREKGDLVMMGIGGFTPLGGFMGEADWYGVCERMSLSDGLFWPIPITLSADADIADGIAIGSDVALVDRLSGEIGAVMTVEQKYKIDKKFECERVYQTADPAHPGVKMVLDQANVNLSGPVRVLTLGDFPTRYPDLFLTPAQTRALFESLGWKKIAAFQTRNPMHRSHEYLAKIAIETCDGLLVHSLLGNLKVGDVPAEIRTRAIAALIDHYFVKRTVLQAGYPLDMRYAGPREALLHALFRQNYGCSHLVVGRDHAGVGNFYGPFDAHRIFDRIPTDALETKPIKIDLTFWCYRCGGMASERTCPHGNDDRLALSGTKLRKMLAEEAEIPAEFSRPEVLLILRRYYQETQQ